MFQVQKLQIIFRLNRCCYNFNNFVAGFSLVVVAAIVGLEAVSGLETDLYADDLRTDFTSPAIQCGDSREVNLREAVFIESPNFSLRKKYPNSINCKWNFRLNKCTLAISCPNFDLNAFLCFDYLEVSDGIGRAKRFCGKEGPQNLYLDKTATITFKSSPTFSATGFRCFALCVEPGPVTHSVLTPAQPSIPYTSLGQCVCGRGNRPSKYAMQEEFPWVAKLIRKSDQDLFCSATVVSNQYLISAAHCFSNKDISNPEDIQVILNGKPKQTKQKSRLLNKPRHIISINRFRNGGSVFESDSDVSILKLKEPIDFLREGISPICLPKGEERSNHYTGTQAVSSQWAWDSSGQGQQQLLNMKSLVISNENCSDIHRTNKNDPFPSRASSLSILCARSSISNLCHPISGATLMSVEDKGRFRKYTQIGIGSWGYDCGLRKRMPQIYTRVTEIVDWILTNTQDSSFCKA